MSRIPLFLVACAIAIPAAAEAGPARVSVAPIAKTTTQGDAVALQLRNRGRTRIQLPCAPRPEDVTLTDAAGTTFGLDPALFPDRSCGVAVVRGGGTLRFEVPTAATFSVTELGKPVEARFLRLAPGAYRVVVRLSDRELATEVVVAGDVAALAADQQTKLDDQVRAALAADGPYRVIVELAKTPSRADIARYGLEPLATDLMIATVSRRRLAELAAEAYVTAISLDALDGAL